MTEGGMSMEKDRISKKERIAKDKTKEILIKTTESIKDVGSEYAIQSLCCIIASLLAQFYSIRRREVSLDEAEKYVQEIVNEGRRMRERFEEQAVGHKIGVTIKDRGGVEE